jgi:hypothetical protein
VVRMSGLMTFIVDGRGLLGCELSILTQGTFGLPGVLRSMGCIAKLMSSRLYVSVIIFFINEPLFLGNKKTLGFYARVLNYFFSLLIKN